MHKRNTLSDDCANVGSVNMVKKLYIYRQLIRAGCTYSR